MELADKLYGEIVAFYQKGDRFVESGQLDVAIESYRAALDLLPAPKTNWEAGTWIYTALGDTYYLIGQYDLAKNYLYEALNGPDGLANPFILLRLGESLYEIGAYEQAQEYLLRAFMIEGYKIFAHEDEKYFDVIKGSI